MIMGKETTVCEYIGLKNKKLHKLIMSNKLWDIKLIGPMGLDDTAQIVVMIKRQNEGKWETYYVKM
jgi:hypothetical protein